MSAPQALSPPAQGLAGSCKHRRADLQVIKLSQEAQMWPGWPENKGLVGCSPASPARMALVVQVSIPAPAFLVFCFSFRHPNCKMELLTIPRPVWRMKRPTGPADSIAVGTAREAGAAPVIPVLCRGWEQGASQGGDGPARRPAGSGLGCSAFQELQPIRFGRAGQAQVPVRELAARPRTLHLPL